MDCDLNVQHSCFERIKVRLVAEVESSCVYRCTPCNHARNFSLFATDLTVEFLAKQSMSHWQRWRVYQEMWLSKLDPIRRLTVRIPNIHENVCARTFVMPCAPIHASLTFANNETNYNWGNHDSWSRRSGCCEESEHNKSHSHDLFVMLLLLWNCAGRCACACHAYANNAHAHSPSYHNKL